MTVCRVLREKLVVEREQGSSFAEAWNRCLLIALHYARDEHERGEWESQLACDRETWRESYERLPSAHSSHLSVLAEHGDRVPCGERQCARCDGDIPPERPAFARYCSRDCYEEAALERDWQGSRERARKSHKRRRLAAA